MLLRGCLMRSGGVLVCLLRMLLRRSRVLFRFLVLAALVMVHRFEVMMGSRFVVGHGVHVVLD